MENRKAGEESGVVVHAYRLSISKAETGRVQVPSQPGLYSKILSQMKHREILEVGSLSSSFCLQEVVSFHRCLCCRHL